MSLGPRDAVSDRRSSIDHARQDMLLVKNAIFATAFAIVFTPIALGQTITYDGLNRIESVKNLLVNGTIYDVTTSYGIPVNGASPGPGDIPDADIAAAIAAIASLSDVGGASLDPISFLYVGAQSQSGLVTDVYKALGVIRRVPFAPSPSNNGTSGMIDADNTGSPSVGLASFTAVPAPEPTTFALAAGLSLLGVYSHRRRRRLMKS